MPSRGFRLGLGFAGLLVAIAVVNLSIAGKERLLAHGRIVYLELAPVDPRSLMQGDYMRLDYRLVADIRNLLPRSPRDAPWLPELAPSDGRAVVTLDERSVAQFHRLDDGTPLAPDEVRLRYRVRAGTLRFASDAFFFEEGTAEAYEAARYGEYRVGPDGELLLTGLYDENRVRLPNSDSEPAR